MRKPPCEERLPVLLVDVDPDTAAPIAVASMFAPLAVVLLGKLPIVGMDVELELGLVFGLALDVPAVAFVVADDEPYVPHIGEV
jgi:hypothetical protein